MTAAQRWRCPSCHQELEALAVAVGHRCASRQNRIVDWYLLDELETEDTE